VRGSADNDRSRRGEVRFVTLLAAVLLLVCCVNLAGLLMARNSARAREFAIRSSLGAGRGRLVRQLVTESLVLAVAGGALGVLLSLVLTAAIRSRFFAFDGAGRPLYYDFTFRPAVVLAALGMAAAAGLLMGLAPALRSIRGGAANTLKRYATATTVDARAGRCLVAAQAAVAVALVGIATLLTANAQARLGGAGFEPSHIALMRLRPSLIQYAPDKAQRFQRAVIDRLSAIPGVESMSMVGTGVVWLGGSARVALPESTGAPLENCGFIDVGSRYFETLRIPVLLGREFDDRDTVNSPAVAIVNEALARRLRPSAGVLGQVLMVNGKPHWVVGLVKDAQSQPRGTSPSPYVYVPYWQNPNQVDSRVCLRVTGDPAAMLSTLTREVSRLDPDVPVSETVTLPLQLAGGLRSLRITASFVSYAAILAVLLSAIGVYSALAFSVSRRTKEIGIRLAVGAQQREVRAMVMREGMIVVLAGALAGIGLAAASTRAVKHLLFGSAGADLYWFAAACIVVLAAGLLACWLPAIKATRVQPVDALRC
jgi:putative ABC transport system permease protein